MFHRIRVTLSCAAFFMALSFGHAALAWEISTSDCDLLPGDTDRADVANANICETSSLTVGPNDILTVDTILSVGRVENGDVVPGTLTNQGTIRIIAPTPGVAAHSLIEIKAGSELTNFESLGRISVENGGGLHIHGSLNNEWALDVLDGGHVISDGSIVNKRTGTITNFGDFGKGSPQLVEGRLRNRGYIYNNSHFQNFGTIVNHNIIRNLETFINGPTEDLGDITVELRNTETTANGDPAQFQNAGSFENSAAAIINSQIFLNEEGAGLFIRSGSSFDNEGDTGRLVNNGSITNLGDIQNSESAQIENSGQGSIDNSGLILNQASADIINMAKLLVREDGRLSNLTEGQVTNLPPGRIANAGVFRNAGQFATIENRSRIIVEQTGSVENSDQASFENRDQLTQDGRLDNTRGGIVRNAASGRIAHQCEAVTTTEAPAGAGPFAKLINDGVIRQTGGTLPPANLILGNGILRRSLPADCRPTGCSDDADCPDITRCATFLLKPNQCVVPCTVNDECIPPETCWQPAGTKFKRCT